MASGRSSTAALSGVLTLVVTVGLWAGDSLRGPDFFGGEAAVGEAIVFAVLGAAVGSAWARSRGPAFG